MRYYPQYPYATQLYTGGPTQHGFGQAENYTDYYCSSMPWAGGRADLAGLGEIPGILSDAGLEERVEQIVRGSAIKTLTEPSSLGALTDEQFERALTRRTLQGLAAGDVEPLTQQQFEQKLYRLFTKANQLSGFFSSIKKAVKKVTSGVKKVAKKVVKGVKKVVPIAVAGAALYFSGGAAAPMLQKFSPVIGKYWGGWNKTVGKVFGQAPPPAPEYPVETFTDPQITQAAVPMAQYQLAQQGINVNSPEGKAMLAQYARYNQVQMQAQTGGRPINMGPTGGVVGPIRQQPAGGGLAKMALPLAIGAGALLLLTR